MNSRGLFPIKYQGIAALFLGLSFFSGFALADSLEGWKHQEVKPVVMCRWDSFYGFIPVSEKASVSSPTWTKEQVTPIVDCRYEDFAFRPKSAEGTAPRWEKNQVEPWVEVIPNSFGEFIIKQSDS